MGFANFDALEKSDCIGLLLLRAPLRVIFLAMTPLQYYHPLIHGGHGSMWSHTAGNALCCRSTDSGSLLLSESSHQHSVPTVDCGELNRGIE